MGSHIPQFKLENLLNLSPESFYWIGFLFADGYLTDNYISITLSSKDKVILENFATYVANGNNIPIIRTFSKLGNLTNVYDSYEYCNIHIGDKQNVLKIRDAFDFQKRKTYNPPNLSSFLDTKEKLISWLAGNIDGDGSITKQTGTDRSTISIAVHENWAEQYKWVNQEILKYFNYSGTVTFPREGLVRLKFFDTKLQHDLKTEILRLNLPILKRKWDNINLDFIERKDKRKNKQQECLDLINQGLSRHHIMYQLNISSTRYYDYKNKTW